MEKQIVASIADRFADFIIRAIIPMSVMLLVFILSDTIFTDSALLNKIFGIFITDKNNLKLGIFLILGIGVGLLVSILHQSLDMLNIKNYDCRMTTQKRKDEFSRLRDKVAAKLKQEGILSKLPTEFYSEEKLTDFKLYNILGNEKVFGKLIHVQRYNDQARQLYTIYIGIALNIVMFGVLYNLLEKKDIFTSICYVAIIFVLGFVFVCSARARYKARNTRLYINYLLQEKEQNTSEIKNGNQPNASEGTKK